MLSLCLYSTGNFNPTRGGRREVVVGGISNESSGFPASSNWIWIKSFPSLPDLRGHVQEVSEIFGELDETQFCLDWHLVDQVTYWRGLHTRAPYHCSQKGSHQLLQRVSGSLWGNQPSWHGRTSLWMYLVCKPPAKNWCTPLLSTLPEWKHPSIPWRNLTPHFLNKDSREARVQSQGLCSAQHVQSRAGHAWMQAESQVHGLINSELEET